MDEFRGSAATLLSMQATVAAKMVSGGSHQILKDCVTARCAPSELSVMQYTLRQCSDLDCEWAYALKREAYREVVERQFGPWNEERQRRMFADR